MSVFTKLNLKDHDSIVVLNAPASFEPQLAALDGVTVSRTDDGDEGLSFALAFVVTQAELDAASTALTQRAIGDATIWLAYPKQSSKRYRCEFNRDSGWPAMGRAGYETVRMVAIDEDWSALRFRKNEFVKNKTGAQRTRAA